MHSLKSELNIDFGHKDWDIGEQLSILVGPINNPLDACSEHAGEELFHFDVTVD
jgi:hypothetical protein